MPKVLKVTKRAVMEAKAYHKYDGIHRYVELIHIN